MNIVLDKTLASRLLEALSQLTDEQNTVEIELPIVELTEDEIIRSKLVCELTVLDLSSLADTVPFNIQDCLLIDNEGALDV